MFQTLSSKSRKRFPDCFLLHLIFSNYFIISPSLLPLLFYFLSRYALMFIGRFCFGKDLFQREASRYHFDTISNEKKIRFFFFSNQFSVNSGLFKKLFKFLLQFCHPPFFRQNLALPIRQKNFQVLQKFLNFFKFLQIF